MSATSARQSIGTAALAALMMMGWCGAATASSPELDRVDPPGWQRGDEVTITLHGRRLHDPRQVLFYGEGIEVKGIEPLEAGKPNPNAFRATIEIAADCPLGEHALRVRARRGWSHLRTFSVGALPVVEEAEPNDSFERPQRIDMDVTVHGVVRNEDVDYYLIEAKKGQRITAEVEGIRLGRTMFDPYVAILDGRRFELDGRDDTPLLRQDAFASVIAPEDGAYVVMVREAAYGGDDKSAYRLHVGRMPRPTMVYPLGGPAGEPLDVRYIGDRAGPIEATVELPAEPMDKLGVYAEDEDGAAPSPNWLRVSPFGNVLEAEPNNGRGQATSGGAEATEPPLAFNGILGEEGDHDWFRFRAKKGQTLEARVYARGLGSPVDAVLNVFVAGGKHLEGNDDSRGELDSFVRVRIPEDGAYELRVRDRLGRGGADYVYRVELTPARPELGLVIPDVRRNDDQSRQFISVPRGNRWGVLLQANRGNFGGDLRFIAERLPPGVTMHAPVMKANVNRVPIVFEAAADADPDAPGVLAELRARHAEEQRGIEGRFTQTASLVRGNPNNTPYYRTTVAGLPVAVTEEAPFRVRIEEPKVPLVRRGRMALKVIVEREEGFERDVRVHLPFRPPGLGTRYSIKVPKGQSEAAYPLNANGNAALGDWPLMVIAWSGVEGGPLYVASQMASMTIAEPIATGGVRMTAVERGRAAQVVCQLDVRTPFEGEATLELHGLPHGAAAEAVTITKDSAEAVFEVATSADSPVGQHKSLLCVLRLERAGGTIVQTVAGGGVLRIDEPRPAPQAVAEKPEPKKEPEPQPQKRLSRLEQLRQEVAAKRQAAASND